ncbi:unnamed protein product, partial [Pleuronectes platessa]
DRLSSLHLSCPRWPPVASRSCPPHCPRAALQVESRTSAAGAGQPERAAAAGQLLRRVSWVRARPSRRHRAVRAGLIRQGLSARPL